VTNTTDSEDKKVIDSQASRKSKTIKDKDKSVLTEFNNSNHSLFSIGKVNEQKAMLDEI
jgi:hypothetical protein